MEQLNYFTELSQVASCRPSMSDLLVLTYRPRRGRTGARLDVVRPLWGRFLPTIGCPQVP